MAYIKIRNDVKCTCGHGAGCHTLYNSVEGAGMCIICACEKFVEHLQTTPFPQADVTCASVTTNVPGLGSSITVPSGTSYDTAPLPWATSNKTPHRCPVCGGRGRMDSGFYSGTIFYTGSVLETCRSCGGTGIVWG